MKVRILTLLITLSFSFTLAFGQGFYENKQFGIKALKPEDWILTTNEDLENNLKKLEFNEEQLIKILNSNKGIITLCSYYKYRIDSISGLIPTTKVTIRSNPTYSYSDFKTMKTESTDRVRTVVSDFEFIEKLQDIKVSGFPALHYSCRYSINTTDGSKIKVRNRYYMIPKGTYFISISLMDNETNENCAKVYNEFIASLQLTK